MQSTLNGKFGPLKHFQDAWSVLFVAFYLACISLAFLANIPLLWRSLFVFMAVKLYMGPVCYIQHNHAHVPIFRNTILNEIFSIACFLACGVSTEGYVAHHVMNHHKFNNGPKDWSSIYTFAGCEYPTKPVALWRYIVTFPYRAISNTYRYFRDEAPAGFKRRCIRSLIIVGGIVTCCLVARPIPTVICFFVPWAVVWIALPRNNYRHHVGCDMSTPERTSWSRAYNLKDMVGMQWPHDPRVKQACWDFVNIRHHQEFLATFGLGLHAVHHLKPGLHWYELPAEHVTRVMSGELSHDYIDISRRPLHPGLDKIRQKWEQANDSNQPVPFHPATETLRQMLEAPPVPPAP